MNTRCTLKASGSVKRRRLLFWVPAICCLVLLVVAPVQCSRVFRFTETDQIQGFATLAALTDLRRAPEDQNARATAETSLERLTAALLGRLGYPWGWLLATPQRDALVTTWSKRLVASYVVETAQAVRSAPEHSRITGTSRPSFEETAHLFFDSTSSVLSELLALPTEVLALPSIVGSALAQTLAGAVVLGLLRVGVLTDRLEMSVDSMASIQGVLRLVTVEQTVSGRVRSAYVQQFFGLFESGSAVSFAYDATLTAGFDLSEQIRVTLDHTSRKLIVDLPAPRILSVGAVPSLETWEDGWLVRVNPVQIKTALEGIRGEVNESAEKYEVLDHALQEAVRVLPPYIDALTGRSLGELGYRVEIRSSAYEQLVHPHPEAATHISQSAAGAPNT